MILQRIEPYGLDPLSCMTIVSKLTFRICQKTLDKNILNFQTFENPSSSPQHVYTYLLYGIIS